MNKEKNQTNYSKQPASSASRSTKIQKHFSRSRSDSDKSSQKTENSTKSVGIQLEGIPIKFKSKNLEVLYKKKKGTKRYPKSVVNGFFKAMDMISGNTSDPNQLSFKNLKFHRLERNCQQDYALWLTGNWRLITQFEEIEGTKYLLILKIEDYH
jgi:plasmid maintenance system killer protein